jgi:hypothetical protein
MIGRGNYKSTLNESAQYLMKVSEGNDPVIQVNVTLTAALNTQSATETDNMSLQAIA